MNDDIQLVTVVPNKSVQTPSKTKQYVQLLSKNKHLTESGQRERSCVQSFKQFLEHLPQKLKAESYFRYFVHTNCMNSIQVYVSLKSPPQKCSCLVRYLEGGYLIYWSSAED